GAGGLSSSVGEMALLSNGAEIDLSLCPVKYPGLVPYELMISESQERMTFAVDPTNLAEFLHLAIKRGVQATDIGEFNNSGNLSIKYNRELVALLDLDFLHNTLPPMQLNAYWNGPTERNDWSAKKQKKNLDLTNINYESILTTILSAPNISSKESLVRRYDHEVQCATHIKPFVGTTEQGPSDSGVVWLYPHGGSKDNAISIGCGLNPRLSLYDPYIMAQASVDEAIRNVVVTGGDLEYLCLLDNFCWPDPLVDSKTERGDYKLGQLVRACQGLSDICSDYSTPLVSGKDSMKNDYSGKSYDNQNIKISIQPTLLVTAMSKCNINHTVTSDYKNAGDLIYLIGKNSLGLFASELLEHFELNSIETSFPPAIDTSINYQLYKQYHKAIKSNLIKSAHDISDGGLSVALCESMIGGDFGANINLSMEQNNFINLLFGEATGRFLISIDKNNKDKFEKYFSQTEIIPLGEVSDSKKLQIENSSETVINLSLQEIKNAWSKELL
ncbi:MAG: phosphoribosylformylglycinamidine synthase, partial [Bdellovibrionales bacterium]|nr:phosphoribosylformylglycinamidine synthase [Bdellovibrionales bacterium]